MNVNWIDVDFKNFNNTFNEAIEIIENNWFILFLYLYFFCFIVLFK
jgi:hypothetical protein